MQMKYLRRFGTFAADGKHRLLARGLAVAALWIGAWAIAPAQAADIQGDAAAGAQKNHDQIRDLRDVARAQK